MEFVIILLVVLFVVLYRKSSGTSVYKFVVDNVETIYEKYAPYSFKVVREKCKEMGLEYNRKQYTTQVIIFAVLAFVISYLYFYNAVISLIYVILTVSVIPYLAYLRCKRVYSEFVFEQIQVYVTNTIMEFSVTQSFVKALEGVYNSGIFIVTSSENMRPAEAGRGYLQRFPRVRQNAVITVQQRTVSITENDLIHKSLLRSPFCSSVYHASAGSATNPASMIVFVFVNIQFIITC